MKHVVVLDKIRSLYNVGSIIRTSDAFGIGEAILCGYTPTPDHKRFEHMQSRDPDSQIAKTGLKGLKTVAWRHEESAEIAIRKLKEAGYFCIAIEQHPTSIPLAKPPFHAMHSVLSSQTGDETRQQDMGSRPGFRVKPGMTNEHVESRNDNLLSPQTSDASVPFLSSQTRNQPAPLLSFSTGSAGIPSLSSRTGDAKRQQDPGSMPAVSWIPDVSSPAHAGDRLEDDKQAIAIVVGNELDGVSPDALALCDQIMEIPMQGEGDSLNVAVAFGIAAHTLLT